MKNFTLLVLLLMSAAAMAATARDAEGTTSGPMFVGDPVVPTLTPAVRDLPDFVQDPGMFGTEMKRRENYGFVPVEYPHEPKTDPLVDLQYGAGVRTTDTGFATLIHNYAGQSSNVSPPDDNGDVGPNHYIQITNQSTSTARVINKGTGANMKTFALQTLATSTPCNSGFCDPVVLYDRMADRWILTELPDSSGGYLCVYVSTSPDPTGSYYAYAFNVESSLPDYPKYGVWPQKGSGGSYLVGMNASSTSDRWDLAAFDRAKMLAGQPASFQKFSVPALANASFQLVLPSTVQGPNPPPDGEPALFARPHDDENADSPAGSTPAYDWIDLWALSVDWTTPANSTLTQLPNVNIGDYDMTLCGMGGTWNCMPQPGTQQKIDPIREPLHFPFQYRSFGDHQSLVGTFVEDVDGHDHAALRWFELRKDTAGWYLKQEGVIGGESGVHRSVGSIAMDGAGDIAIGYTRTGGTAPYYPSIYYKGRLASDPAGTMPQGEYPIVDATTSNIDNERWGDYSGMGVDPADDCTFWYTTEYGGSGLIKVAAFKFDACFSQGKIVSQANGFTDACAGTGSGNANGVIDAGETITLDPVLRNSGGATLTGLGGTLTTTTSGISITTAAASYPDIASAATASSNAPHFVFTVGTGVACGTTIALTLHVTAAAGGPWDIPIALTTGTSITGGPQTVFAQDFKSAKAPALPSGWTTQTVSGAAWQTDRLGCTNNALRYPGTSKAADSWVFTPGVLLTAGVTYTLGFNQKDSSTAVVNKLAATVGAAPNASAQTTTLWSNTALKNGACAPRGATFTPASTGTYYFGFHATSAANARYMYVDDVSVKAVITPSCTMNACNP